MYEQFQKLMEARGITPYKVAKDTGIAQSTLSDWKNGKITPKADKIKKLSKYFDVPMDYFVDDPVVVIKPAYDNKRHAMHVTIDSMDQRRYEELVKYVKFLMSDDNGD